MMEVCKNTKRFVDILTDELFFWDNFYLLNLKKLAAVWFLINLIIFKKLFYHLSLKNDFIIRQITSQVTSNVWFLGSWIILTPFPRLLPQGLPIRGTLGHNLALLSKTVKSYTKVTHN